MTASVGSKLQCRMVRLKKRDLLLCELHRLLQKSRLLFLKEEKEKEEEEEMEEMEKEEEEKKWKRKRR